MLDASTSYVQLIVRRGASYLSRKRGLYAVLGVERTATSEEIKKAFVKRSTELHPDRAGAEDPLAKWRSRSRTEEFMELKEAYDILRKPEKRAKYDAELNAVSGTGGFLREVSTSNYREPTVLDLQRARNESYTGPSKGVIDTGHFRDPLKELEEEERKNRGLVLIAAVVLCAILVNVGYVSYLQAMKEKSATQNPRR